MANEATAPEETEVTDPVPFLDHLRGPAFPLQPSPQQTFFRSDLRKHFQWTPAVAGVGAVAGAIPAAGGSWVPRVVGTEDVAARWYAILETKSEPDQKLGAYFVLLPFTPGKWFDLFRGDTLPATWIYRGRVFFHVPTQQHYRYDVKAFAQGDAAKPQWFSINEAPEMESARRYAILDAQPEDVQQRAIIFLWHPYLIAPGEFAKENTFLNDLFAPPKRMPPKTKAQKDAEALAAMEASRVTLPETPAAIKGGAA